MVNGEARNALLDVATCKWVAEDPVDWLAEQLLDVGDRTRSRSEPRERVTTSGEGDEQRQGERRGAPSSLAHAAVAWKGQRVLRRDVRG